MDARTVTSTRPEPPSPAPAPAAARQRTVTRRTLGRVRSTDAFSPSRSADEHLLDALEHLRTDARLVPIDVCVVRNDAVRRPTVSPVGRERNGYDDSPITRPGGNGRDLRVRAG